MSLFVVDVEADGQSPWERSMVCLGAVRVDRDLRDTFYGQMAPISDKWDPESLEISGFTRAQHETFPDPKETMTKFFNWVEAVNRGRATFVSDNVAFDWQWVNYYFHRFVGTNPFGWTARRIGDLYCGMERDMFAKWKHLRVTPHTHNPVDDAMGNAEALLKMKEMGLRMPR